MMTTMAALLGALPLALGTGTGSELRRPLGITIVGGLIVSQMLTLYTTPVVYLYLDRFRLWREQRGHRRARPGRAAGARMNAACPRNRHGQDAVAHPCTAARPQRASRAGLAQPAGRLSALHCPCPGSRRLAA